MVKEKMSYSKRMDLAERTNDIPEMEVLSSDKDWSVKNALAGNKNVPAYILIKMVPPFRMGDPWMRWTIKENLQSRGIYILLPNEIFE